MSQRRKCLYLLDGNSLTHRAFYALPPMNNAEGLPTNAVFGFTRMLLKLIKDEKPDFLAVAFDMKAPTFRHREFLAYKGTRDKTPDELIPQFELVRDVLNAFAIPIFMKEGYEADDLLGTLAKTGERQGHHVTIVTGDRDAFQLVSENIRVMYNKKGITDIEDINLAKVREKYGIEPIQLIDTKGLMGDTSDNIPGVPGIGEKTALALISQYGTLEEVYAHIDGISGKKRQETLATHKDDAFLSKRLATIVTDVPMEIDFSQCEITEPDNAKVAEVFARLGFKSLYDQFAVQAADDRPRVEAVEYITLTDEKQLVDELAKMDRETVYLDILLSGDDPMRSVVTDLVFMGRDGRLYHWPIQKAPEATKNLSLFSEPDQGPDPALIADTLKKLLTADDTPKVLYQAKMKMVALRRYGVEMEGLAFDPDIAVYLLNPSEKALTWPEIVSEHLGLTLPSDQEPIMAAALRVSLLPKLDEILGNRLDEAQVTDLMMEIELPLENVLAEMEFNGIDLDEPFLRDLSRELGQRIDQVSREIYAIADRQFNLNSPKQLGEILFDKMGMPVIKKTKTGYSTGVEVLEELEKHDTTGIIQKIYEYRELSKLKSTYVDALPPLVHPETGRIHTYFNQTVTATGRLSSTEPNLQNIPIRTEEGRKIRAAFIAGHEGTVLLTADYSQVELRVLAHISNDPGLIQAFQDNADIHTRTASEVFEIPPDQVDKEHRRRAKAINFGIAYGLSPFGLSKDLGIPMKEAENYIHKYFTEYRGVKDYIDSTIALAKVQGYVTTLENRRRYLPEINARNFQQRSFAERMAINTPIQGSAADIMKIAMIRVYQALKKGQYRSKLLLQVHDELVLEVYPEELLEIAQLVRTEMEQAYELAVPLIVDVETGVNWRDQETFAG